jgi:3-deoxy-D-manno-octulosonic-acid transferase
MNILFYSLYNSLVYIALPIIWIGAFFNDKLGGSLTGQKDINSRVLRFKDKVKINPKPIIWTHSASAGEFEQMLPVITRLSKMDVYIFQTFTSTTIYYKASQNKIFDGVSFLPWDLYSRVNRFITLLKPDLFINTRHDIWPNLQRALQTNNIRNILINANLYQDSKRLLPLFRGVNSLVFNKIDHIYAGSDSLKSLLQQIYSGPVDVVGDSRFDQVYERSLKNTEMLITSDFISDRRVIVYGSVGSSDLQIITDAIVQTATTMAFMHIIVPHETAERDLIPWERELFRGKIRSIRKSEIEQYKDESVLIWDSVGQLADLYKYADLAYIGAGFGAGVHSVTEAAIYKVPCAHGPKYDILAEAIDLVDEGLSTITEEPQDLSAFLTMPEDARLALSGRIESFVHIRIGATDRIFERESLMGTLTPLKS